jgi:anti-anti-sigma factor
MARLECTLTDITAPGHAPATMVSLSGSVDPDTLAIFEETMDRLIEQKKVRIIFNMAKLKYINSTGMGMSVQFADQLAEENGSLVLMKVPPKVLLVIEMLGLQELFPIVSTEEQALAALSGKDVGPASIQVKLEEPVSVSIPETVTVEAADEVPETETLPAGAAQVIGCPVCSARLSVPGAGPFRCPRCRSAFEADADGNAQGYPEPAAHVAEISFPGDPDYMAGAGWMVNMAGRKAGLSEHAAQAAADATEGCLRLLATEALNGSAATSRLHLFLRSQEGRLSVRLYCGGSALGSPEAVTALGAGVGRLEYMPSAEGNLITLEQSE